MHYFAIDLGATSGRTILATVTGGKVELEEINRFPNHIIRIGGHCHWDIFELYRNILEGLKKVADKGIKPKSIGIDTWGVDVALVGADGGLLRMPYSYRDTHTQGAPEAFFSRFSEDKTYARTGIQVMNINTLFQLDTMRRNNDSALAAAAKILFMPDALNYLLTGNMATEYTIASTGQIVNARSRSIDAEIIEAVGLTVDHFGRMIYPGEVMGTLTPEVQRLTGLGAVPVVAVGSHDTASAVAAVPATTPNFAYLSSGTWSLMGIEVDEPIINDTSRRNNFTNEGGISGKIRFLKNICGMWLLERCRSEWGNADYAELLAEAMKCEPFRSIINPDDEIYANPQSMTEAIARYCRATQQPEPQSRGEYVRCILESLALRYRQVMDMLRDMAPFNIEVLHIIGGGSRNDILNQFTANATGLKVIAGPTECTALGNVMVQAGLSRQQVADCVKTKTFTPADTDVWSTAYDKYLAIVVN